MTDAQTEDFMNSQSISIKRLHESRFFLVATLVSSLIIFAGFAQTFYLKSWFDSPQLSNVLFVHGVIMTFWFALLFSQLALVSKGRIDLHRRLGQFSVVLIVLILISGWLVTLDSARRGFTPDPSITPQMFMVIPLADLLVFVILVGAALWNRKRTDYHKRFMLLATVSILTPGLARLPLAFVREGGLPVFYGALISLVVICVLADSILNRRLHPVMGWGAAFLILSIPARIMLAQTQLWNDFASWLVR